MRFYEIVVEQLDLAAELLQKQHPMESRLALILVDNATEYALHRFATDYFKLTDARYGCTLEEKRAFFRTKGKVEGQHIKPKIAFARKEGAISADQAMFVRYAHEFRNQAYHAGRTHDPIVTELAAMYYTLFCEMLPGFSPRRMRLKSNATLTERVKRHMPVPAVIMPGPSCSCEIALSLLHILPQVECEIAVALRAALADWLAEIDEVIDYLVRNDDSAKEAEFLIQDTQYRNDLWAGAPPEGFMFCDDGSGDVAVDPSQKAAWEQMHENMKDWRPNVTAQTLERWKRRVDGLISGDPPGILLQKYCKLVAEIEPFKKMIERRCAAFDQYIEELIDDARDTELRGRLESGTQ